jgi:hypothetical protein
MEQELSLGYHFLLRSLMLSQTICVHYQLRYVKKKVYQMQLDKPPLSIVTKKTLNHYSHGWILKITKHQLMRNLEKF